MLCINPARLRMKYNNILKRLHSFIMILVAQYRANQKAFYYNNLSLSLYTKSLICKRGNHEIYQKQNHATISTSIVLLISSPIPFFCQVCGEYGACTKILLYFLISHLVY